MRRRSGRERARAERADADASGESQPRPMIDWDELSPPEQLALKRLNRGHDPQLDPETAERLLELGLAVRRAQGIGISRSGRELVINVLLKSEA
ncbi:MAG: hypothetical protein ACTHJV_12190 [Rhizobiaceae bacterium]